jgi:hypothetical protein
VSGLQVKGLEYDPHLFVAIGRKLFVAGFAEVLAIDLDFSSGGGIEASYNVKECALARS